MTHKLTFRPLKLETVVVMRGNKVVGRINRYLAHRCCVAAVPGILHPSSHPGQCSFPTIAEAKKRIMELDDGVHAQSR